MANIINGSFEVIDPGGPGIPLGWTVQAAAPAELYADFGGSDLNDFDSFEIDWANDSYIFVFDPLTDIVAPLFDTGVSPGQTFENFEEGWSSNEDYVSSLTSGISAVFDGESFEDFEEQWSSNESYSFTMGSTVTASFDGESFEDFEEQWSSNESYSFTMGSTSTAVFDGSSPENFEDFEECAALIPIVADPVTDTFTSTAHGLPNGARVTFVSDGQLPAGLAGTTTYYVINTAANTFQVSLTLAGAVHPFTTGENGSTWTRRDPALFWVSFLS